MSTMTIRSPGGKKVDAEFRGFTIRIGQSVEGGGVAAAPQPFDLFLAPIATCAGICVRGFCDSRGLATEGLALEMRIERQADGHRITRLVLEIHLPPRFP